MERGIDGVALFYEGMKYIGIGHVAKRFMKKYTFSLAELRKRYPNNDAAHLVMLRVQRQEEEGGAGEENGLDTNHDSSDSSGEELNAPVRGSRDSLRGGRGSGRNKRSLQGGSTRGGRRGGKNAKKKPKSAREVAAEQGARSLNRSNEQQVTCCSYMH